MSWRRTTGALGRGRGQRARSTAWQSLTPHPRNAATRTTAGIRLAGLTKNYGAVRAVDAIDLEIAPGETVALLGPNGAGKSTTIDMILGLAKPDAGSVQVFGMTPAEAVRAGAIGAMLQTGQLLRDLTVRELITMMASLYPNPMACRRGARADRHRRHRRPANAKAVRWPDPAHQSRDRVGVQPRPADSRRTDSRHGRRGAPRVLDLDAQLRGRRQDGGLRDALPRRGRQLRRPHRVDGARAGSSPTGRQPKSRRPSGCARSGRRCPTSRPIDCRPHGVQTPSCEAKPSCCIAPTPTPRSVRCLRELPAGQRHRDRRRRSRRGVPSADRRPEIRGTLVNATYLQLRTHSQRAQQARLHLLARLFRWCSSTSWPAATGTRNSAASRSRPTTWPAWHRSARWARCSRSAHGSPPSDRSAGTVNCG